MSKYNYKVSVGFRTDAKTKEKLQRIAQAQNTTLSELCEQYIKRMLLINQNTKA